jgi:predicted kinase
MLVGVPGSGKTTWMHSQGFDPLTMVISSDRYIEAWAQQSNQSYSEIFPEKISAALRCMESDFGAAVAQNRDIVWDQTNLNVKSRQDKLSRVPSNYHRVAVYFTTPDDQELERRLSSRPGKLIPPHVIKSMVSSLVPPTLAEGFHEVQYVVNKT